MRSELNGYERTGIMFDTFLLIFVAIDAKEELLLASKEWRSKELGHMQGGRQELIVVASLIDRIPNLAGLACTCEVSHRRGWLLHMHSFSCTQSPRQGGKGLGLCTVLSTVAYVSVTWSPEQRCAVVWINIELSIPVCGEEKNQNQRTTGSGYFKNLKELVGFSWKNQWKTSGYIGSHLIKLPNF